MNLIAVNIIVPVYNSQSTIKRCINSLLNQTYSNINIIVVNDGSTDKTSQILETYKKNHKVTILYEKNGGVSKARNLGLEFVKSGLVSFVDSDDYVKENFISNLVTGLIKSDSDICITGIEYKNKNSIKKTKYKSGLIEKNSSKFWNTLFKSNGPRGYMCNKLYKIEKIKKNNIKFDESITIGEDLLFNVKYFNSINKIKVLDKNDYIYILKKESLSRKNEIKVSNLYIKTLQDIKKFLSSVNSNGLSNVDAEIALANVNLIRQLNFSKNNYDIKKLKRTAMKNRWYVLFGNRVTIRQKIIYIITMMSPKLMKIIDNYIMWDIK